MQITKLTLNGHFQMNCYILEEDNEAVIIDPGFDDNKLYDYLNNKNLIINKIILTHGHFDHWGALKKIRFLYPNAKLFASSIDNHWYDSNPFNYKPTIDVDLNNLKEIKLFNRTFKIFKTPGHSKGSISLYHNYHLFSGDVLFKESIGRTDLFEGNQEELFKSIKKLYQLDGKTIIYPGHGPNTSINNERMHNPFIRG